MKISDYIVSFLADKGITDVFGYPGGMVTHLMDSFDRQKDRITAHVNYHEQGSAFCACGYAQAAMLPGVAYATSGPGATNLITGIANAYFDSIPCLFMTGQVNTYESKGKLPVRQKGFQETDIIAMARSVTKYAAQVTQPERIRYELEKAFTLSMSGRPGPVLLDLPMNIQRQDIDPDALRGFIPRKTRPQKPEELSLVIRELESASRPCIVAGAGVKGCGMTREFRALADKLGVPVVSSMIAVDVLPGSGQYYGFIGAYGHRKANFILAKSDLIISMGSRLDCRQVGSAKDDFAPRAKLIRIDVDEDELSNRIKPGELQIAANLREALPWLAEHAPSRLRGRFAGWIGVCDEIAARLDGMDAQEPCRMIKKLSGIIPDHVVITADVGQNQVWLAQSYEVKEHQRMLFSGGHGAMGYSLPAAIGAHYGSGKKVVSFSGDGGIQMNIQELQFVAREKIPVIIVILNNGALGMIRHFQEMYFDSRYIQTVRENGYTAPSFAGIAAAYGLPYHRIEEDGDIHRGIFEQAGPAVVEVVLPGPTYVFPKLAVNKPAHDQEPALDRPLYDYLMGL